MGNKTRALLSEASPVEGRAIQGQVADVGIKRQERCMVASGTTGCFLNASACSRDLF